MRGYGTGIIAVDGVTPTTNFTHSTADNATVGVGNMITMGDTIAEVKVEEVVVVANYTAVEDIKAKSALAALATNYGEVDHTKVKSVHGEKHTPPAALGAYDMSNMKFSFGRNGEHTGPPSGFLVRTSGLIPHSRFPFGVIKNWARKINTNLWHACADYMRGFTKQYNHRLYITPLFFLFHLPSLLFQIHHSAGNESGYRHIEVIHTQHCEPTILERIGFVPCCLA